MCTACFLTDACWYPLLQKWNRFNLEDSGHIWEKDSHTQMQETLLNTRKNIKSDPKEKLPKANTAEINQREVHATFIWYYNNP